MLKMALLDCVVNEKCCSVDRGRGICPLFSSPPRGIWQLKPHPREFATQGKKNANARESALNRKECNCEIAIDTVIAIFMIYIILNAI